MINYIYIIRHPPYGVKYQFTRIAKKFGMDDAVGLGRGARKGDGADQDLLQR